MEKQIEGLTMRIEEAEEQREKAEEDISRNREEREDFERRLKEQEERGSPGAWAGLQYTMYSIGAYSLPPKIPSSAAKISHWQQRMTLFLDSQGFGYTIRHGTNPVPIINNADRASFVYRYGEQTGSDHEKASGFSLDATTDAPFE